MIVIFILVGLLTGLLAGLLGIGGGIITVPAIYYYLLWNSPEITNPMEIAIATSLATTFMTAVSSAWAHHQKKAIRPQLLGYLAPGLGIGCIGGAQIAHLLPTSLLKLIFGSIMFLLAIYFFLPKFKMPNFGDRPNFLLTVLGFLIGNLSSLLGIGGGIFTTPVLVGYGTPFPNAVATSSASTLITALAGSLTYLALSWNSPPLLHTIGYVHLYVFVAIASASVLTAPIGTKLAHHLPVKIIQRIFATAVAATALSMIL